MCVLDDAGVIVWRGKVGSTPEALANAIRTRAPQVARIGLETGPLCTWHWHALHALGLPVICLDARHAKAALSVQMNKTDANDAYGLAQIVRTGWYKEVAVKSLDSHRLRTLLSSRAQLVNMRRDLGTKLRGVLKTFGKVVGKVGERGFEARVRELAAGAGPRRPSRRCSPSVSAWSSKLRRLRPASCALPSAAIHAAG